ncbi:FAD/NAD(P)-binding protein [Spirulina sp. CS-785/01]|uniref:FAD/NAD(P)-binding protein n=1 Tax=Spirulina sp. CS-785/01 TaxID=3021716 RepID=UPI00232ED1D5|nr:FAD/NAD(P)-binding protein [Spirulina sp. CS-785/01]
MTASSLPKHLDLAIVGAGPQALTLVTHLLQKRAKLRHRLRVFDASGTWLSRWQRQMQAQEIEHLRSPAVHHPHPNPYALRRFAENRPQELFPPYDLPGTDLFNEFCGEVIQRWNLQSCVYPGQVSRIIPVQPWRPRFQLVLQDGQSCLARRVVLATGGGVPRFPDWVQSLQGSYPPDRLVHGTRVDLAKANVQTGERILIIGGGLSSGHLALGVARRGAIATLLIRRSLQEKLFDADPGWLGPKYLKSFQAELDEFSRWQQIQDARNGGSMTPEVAFQLRRAARRGEVLLNEHCQIVQAQWQETQWLVKCSDGSHLQAERIWCATGTTLDISQNPLMTDVLATYPTKIIQGLPVLDAHLRLPGSQLFLMGGYAALQVGPVARNLAGGRLACDRIVPAIVKPSLA